MLVAFRLHRYVEIAQSWGARDPKALERWVKAHVPAGAYVYAPVPFYVAVRRADASFVDYVPSWGFGSAQDAQSLRWEPDPESRRHPQFSVVPINAGVLQSTPLLRHSCVTSDPVSTFTPMPIPHQGWLAHIPIVTRAGPAGRTYPSAVLYRIPENCQF